VDTINTSDKAHDRDQKLVDGFLSGKKGDHAVIKQWICVLLKQIHWVDRADLDDISQDVQIKLMLQLRKELFRFHCSLKTYVYRITKNASIDYFRMRSRKKVNPVDPIVYKLEDPMGNPEEMFQTWEKKKMAFKVLRSLPEACLKLFKMFFHDKWTYKQIAEKRQVPEGTVKRQAWECRQKARELRRMFEKA